MTDKPSYITNVSAIHNLKAELFRKQEASKKKNNAASGSGTSISGYQVAKNNFLKPKPSAKKSSSNVGQAEVSTEALSEESLSWEKAKIKLAEKEKLYDRLKQAHYTPEGDEDDQYLVDFGRRVQEDRNLAREAAQSSTSNNIKDEDDSSEDDGGPYSQPSVPAEEWVEYEDYLGRSRKCLRKDVPSIMEENKKLAADMSGRVQAVVDTEATPTLIAASPAVAQIFAQPAGFDFGQTPMGERTLMSDHMRREMERLEWEKNENDIDDADEPDVLGARPVHYQAVRSNEVRNLGVGYYSFSTDEEERQKELENLKSAHEATLRSRAKKDAISAKRKADKDARMAKLRERKGLPPVDTKESEDKADEFEEFEKSLQSEEEAKVDEPTYIPKLGSREWDRGKVEEDLQNLLPKSKRTTENFLEKSRSERNPDFAPPSAYSSAPAFTGPRWTAGQRMEKPGTAFNQMPFDYSDERAPRAEQAAPPVQEYQPWVHIRPWRDRTKESTDSTSGRAAHPDRPWTNAPPPSSYGESPPVRMSFNQATEEEIRKAAWELFNKK